MVTWTKGGQAVLDLRMWIGGREKMQRFRMPTLSEGIVILGIVVVLGALVSPSSHTLTRWELERRVRDWKPAPLKMLGNAELLASDIDLSGDWNWKLAHSSAGITFAPRSGDEFEVHFWTGGCLGGCDWSRTATFAKGVITLDRAVAQNDRRAFNMLYAIRVEDTDYLLAEPDVPRFEEEFRREAGNCSWYVFKRGSNRITQHAPADPAR